MARSFHLAVGIDRAIEELKKGNNLFEPSTPAEVLKDLLEDKKKGHKYYTHCNNRTAEGMCAGHKRK